MSKKPDRCPICGYYLTMAAEFTGSRCIDPGHWQAAGVLGARDYSPMAKIVAWANVELTHRTANHTSAANQP